MPVRGTGFGGPGERMAIWKTVEAAKLSSTAHKKVLDGLAQELKGRTPELVVVGTITTTGSGPRKFALALTADALVRFMELPMGLKVGDSVVRDRPHVVQSQILEEGRIGLVIAGCGEAAWEMSQDAAQALYAALTNGSPEELTDRAVVVDTQAKIAADSAAFKQDVRNLRKKILMSTSIVLGLLVIWAMLSGCSSESAADQALRACIAADAAAEEMNDQTYAGIRPDNPVFPPIEQVSVTVYDTGVYDLAGTASNVKWSCLWTERDGTAKIGWGS